MKPLKTGVAQMVAAAKARIEEIDTPEAVALLADPKTLFVDLRDPREREREGHIPGSFHCPRGMLEFWVDPESPYFKPIFGEDRRFILHCAGGWRSALSAATLQDMGFEAAHLKNGFGDWKKQGGPVEHPAKKT
ncbi:rhodanese-like domain-containing protein [Neomegalonema sp.]|uniref:rhodanese-like domain-containing protein n=1 Tax=Neomegalonema sp. TaxID=2039713 RepID=UPI0026096C7D|nr:rhodanese-like domain-containing protein [Neomegalonema sp.]MDD2868074.1 rhodanese-like domain-containing protein [Neomegalonema sp.]